MKAFSKLTPDKRQRLLDYPEGKIDMVLDTGDFNEVDYRFSIAHTFIIPEEFNVAPFFNSCSIVPKQASYQICL